MQPTSHRAEPWQLDRRRATCSLGAMSAAINLERPDLGLHALHVSAAPVEGSLLAVSSSEDQPAWPAQLTAWPAQLAAWPAQLTDAYVRGNDLVATYAGDASWPFAPQIYWSADLREPAREPDREIIASLALVVSIQTNLLDTHPRIDVRSSLPADEVLMVSVVGDDLLVDSHANGVQGLDPQANACGILWRLSGGALSYAEVMPTSDFRQLAVGRTANGATQSQWELFAEFLEKGVVRRARLQSLFVPRENDVQLVAECCQAIANRPLPLTT
jgi:hypothetical protein